MTRICLYQDDSNIFEHICNPPQVPYPYPISQLKNIYFSSSPCLPLCYISLIQKCENAKLPHHPIIIKMQSPQSSPSSTQFIWNITPSSKVQQARSIIHPAFHYTPLAGGGAGGNDGNQLQTLEYVPLTCSCEAVMNLYCQVDYHGKSIRCCCCGVSMPLPANYAKSITPKSLPYQLLPTNTTFCYKSGIPKPPTNSPQPLPLTSNNCLLFVIDLCILQKQIQAIKKSIIQVLEAVPLNGTVFVGLVSFYRNVNVYELASKINTVFCINGLKEYKDNDILNILGVQGGAQGGHLDGRTYEIFKRFIIPINHKSDIDKIIRRVKDIKRDQTITVNQRASRATGQAINVALALASASIVPPRLVFLLGGPCTVGQGTVIGLSLKQMMRSARELLNGQNIKYFAQAKKYYDSFIKRVINKKIIMDLYAFTLQELGLAEMSELFMSSGGFVVMHEEFSDRIFHESFKKVYFNGGNQGEEGGKVQLYSEAVVSVFVSKDVVVNGAFGRCYSLNKSKSFVSEKTIGIGNTHSWYLGSLDPQRTITILYQTKQSETKQKYYYIQLKTSFRDSDGSMLTRVTTVRKQWSSHVHEIATGFDQEAAIVYLARYCVHKSLVEEQKELRKWLDTCLLRWAAYFAQYRKGDMRSFSLPESMRSFPQYVYHLRRSNFVNRFGSSLDQSFYRAYILNRQSPSNCSTMIQPVLLKYSLQSPQPEAVPLDQEQMQDQVILLLDSYFNVIQWYGSTCTSWYQSQYHLSPDYEHIRQFFQAPKQDIDYIMGSRFPVPNYYMTNPGHSKERYLKSRVNPKKGNNENENTITDDTDLKGFSEHLVRVVTTQTLN